MFEVKVFRAALLSAVALGVMPHHTLAQTNTATSAKTEPIPEVVVQQPASAKPRPRRAAPRARVAEPAAANPAPAVTAGEIPADPTAAPAFSDATPRGTNGTSLSVPNTGQARYEINRTPGAVSVVSDKTYKNSTPTVTIKDALDYVPGVFVQPKWGEDSRLSIRGSGLSRNFHGRGVALIMDGIIPVSTADGASDFQEIDPTAYRYIEVYKGGNALRFGANTLGGAINFVIPTGYDSDAFGVRADVGSFGFRKLAVSSGGVSGAADYFITGTIQEQDGFRDHSDGDSQRGAINVGYRLSENAETRFYLNANRVRQKIPGAVTKASALNSPETAAAANLALDYERNIDSVRVANKTTLRVAPGTLVEFGGFYFDRHLDHPIFQVIDNQNNEGGGFARISDESLISGYRNRFIAGVNIHNGDVRARQFISIAGNRGALSADADQKSDTTVVYAENSFFVTPTVALVSGLSYAHIARQLDDRFLSNGDQSRAADFDFWNPKSGIVWDVTPDAQVFANVSRSTEAPTFSEITINAGAVLALKPQEATTFEIGTRGATPDVIWDVALYRANIENEFQCQAVLASGTCTQVNLDKTIHQGVEIGGGVALLKGILASGPQPDRLWLNAAYTFSDFRFDGDANFGNNQLPGAPRHYVRAELLYKYPSGIYAGPNVEWVPEAYFVDSANTLDTESYALLGAKLGFDDGGPLTAYIEGRNLTDEAYISSASIAARANAASALFEPGTGRAVFAGMAYKW